MERQGIFIILLVASLSLWNCKSPELTPDSARKNLPDRWRSDSDSTTHARMNWKDFFKEEDLLRLIDSAVSNNFDALSAWTRIEASRAGIQAAKGALLPTISANISAAQRRYGLYTMDGAGNATTPIDGDELVPVHLPDFYVGLQTSWEVDLWGKLRAVKASSLAKYFASIEGRNLVVTNLIAEVASSYFELLSLDTKLEIVRETITLQENALNLTTIQQEAGVATRLAVEQFHAQLLSSKALEKEILQSIVEVENHIHLLIGRYPDRIQRDGSRFLSLQLISPSAGVPSDLLSYRPDIRQAEHQLHAANADVRSAQRAFLPSFTITGAYGLQAYKTSFLFASPESVAYGIVGGLTAPLINRRAIKAAFASAKASQLEAFYDYQKAIVNGFLEVHNEMSNIRNLNDIYELKRRQVDLLSESVETSSELFSARRATYLEVILAQRNSLEAKLELIEVKRRQFNSSINLYKALGGGWTR